MPKRKKKVAKKRTIRTGHLLECPTGEFLKAAPEDMFLFQCTMCGICCKNVENAVPLEPVDIFHIAQYLRSQGDVNCDTTQVVEKYATMQYLTDFGYPVLFVNVVGPEKQCVFHKDNRCSIHAAKPLTCRIYPASVGPDSHGGLQFYLVSKRAFHYRGVKHRMRDWMDENFTGDTRVYSLIEYANARSLGIQLRDLKSTGIEADDICRMLLHYRYLAYDMKEGFLPQYNRNMIKLSTVLHNMLADGK